MHTGIAWHHDVDQSAASVSRQICRPAQKSSPVHPKVLMLARLTAHKFLPSWPKARDAMSTATKSEGPVTIKKYANRRLYNTGTSTYVTLEDLATMVKSGEDFAVFDAKTGDDITRSVLAQIIFEQENKAGQNLLPTTFLRQLIRFYGDSMQM